MRYPIALLVGAGLALSCRPATSSTPDQAGLTSAPAVDHGAPPPYAGTWVGPELTLSFAGPWVLVRPTNGEPSQAPIELRATVERHEGDAFALRTSLAGLLPTDFLRPTDWTMLVEQGQLAIAMGDEPLLAYVAGGAPPPLLGPAMLDELELPDEVLMADAIACLELASSRCAELEAKGPEAAGCRELQWATCVAHLGPVISDPTVRAARNNAQLLHTHGLTVRFAGGLLQAATAPERDHARALYQRALEQGAAAVDALERDGPLADDPNLPALLAALEAAREAGLLDDDDPG